VQAQLELILLYYWQGMADQMMALAAEIRAIVEEQGTPAQRGKFFLILALSHLSRDRYTASEECLRLAQTAAAAVKESPDLLEAPHIRFVLGFVHLWRGHFSDAIEHKSAALRMAERVGDRVVQTRCLTYLCVAHRCAHHVEEARICGDQALDLATKIGMTEYVAMVKANFAWIAWREGMWTEAQMSAREALDLWHGMEDPYGFDWMALWPLIAIALRENKMGDAIEGAKALFGPNQHPFAPELTGITRNAIAQWENGETELARTDLASAIEVAQRIGQL